MRSVITGYLDPETRWTASPFCPSQYIGELAYRECGCIYDDPIRLFVQNEYPGLFCWMISCQRHCIFRFLANLVCSYMNLAQVKFRQAIHRQQWSVFCQLCSRNVSSCSQLITDGRIRLYALYRTLGQYARSTAPTPPNPRLNSQIVNCFTSRNMFRESTTKRKIFNLLLTCGVTNVCGRPLLDRG